MNAFKLFFILASCASTIFCVEQGNDDPIVCHLPEKPTNGKIVGVWYEEIVPVYTKLNFVCDEDFVLTPNKTVTCVGQGKWEPPIPVCKHKDEINCNCGENQECARNDQNKFECRCLKGYIEEFQLDIRTGNSEPFTCVKNNGSKHYASVFIQMFISFIIMLIMKH